MMLPRIRPIRRLRLAAYSLVDASAETIDRLLCDESFVIAVGIGIVAIIVILIVLL
jgi:hypothetical protein